MDANLMTFTLGIYFAVLLLGFVIQQVIEYFISPLYGLVEKKSVRLEAFKKTAMRWIALALAILVAFVFIPESTIQMVLNQFGVYGIYNGGTIDEMEMLNLIIGIRLFLAFLIGGGTEITHQIYKFISEYRNKPTDFTDENVELVGEEGV